MSNYRDDSWRNSYDAWKLRSPDQEYGYDDWEEDEPCQHENPDIDILTGDWDCPHCGEHRAATQGEIDAEIEFQRQYAEHEAREQRREFWRRFTLPIRWPIFRLLERIWPRKACRLLDDSEIPF
jgi:hypothetical protein